MFKRLSGAPNIFWFPKKASTAFTNGGLVYADGSGAVQPGDATSGDHFGVIIRAVTSSDDDYATAGAKVPVDMCRPTDLWEVDVPNGDLATGDVGNTCDLEADGAGIDPDATSKNVVTIVGYISASKAIVAVNASAGVKDVATS